MNKITYANKVDTRVTADPEINKVTASTLNEVKTIVNETVDQVEINVSEIVQAVKITGDQSIAGVKTFTDDVNTTQDLHFVDNGKAVFGTSNGLQIWTTGANDYITSNFNSLALSSIADNKSVDINTTQAGGTLKVALRASGASGATSLFHLGSEKLETTSTGVDVTGEVSATTFLGDLNGTINTLTTAITKANATNDTTVATTAFVKNLIGEIPAGLSFEGTWNADTDTPDLSTATPNNGQFWIVSVNGATDLSGITDWKVGDWAIYVTDGAGTDGWQKVDNSSVLDGQGTGQTVALWSGSGDTNTLTNSPITVSGDDVTFAGYINLLDSEKAVFGIGGDLQIYHDGINNNIKGFGGNLEISANNLFLKTNDDSETMAQFIRNGKVELFFNNVAKFRTTNTGVTVTGDISAVEGSFTGLVTMRDRLDLSDSLDNSFIGEYSGTANTTGELNVSVGYQSLKLNTEGSFNTSVGISSLLNNVLGDSNTSIGLQALLNIEGSANVAIGRDAGRSALVGNKNAGNNNIYIGSYTKSSISTTTTNEIVIGDSAIGNGSDTVTLGNDSITNTYLKGDVEVVGNIKADSFIKDSGTSTQFLKADGSVDTTVYASTDNTYNKTDSDSLFTSKTLSQNISFGEGYASNYRSRVLDYGGTFFPRPLGYEIGLMKEQNLFQKAKLSLLPSGVGVGNLHNIKPKNDTFNFTRASSATYIDEDGLIAISPINTPRLNYPLIDGVVNGCPSHLLEPERLQKIQYSEDFSQSAFYDLSNDVTIETSSIISPKGIIGVQELRENSDNDDHLIKSVNTFTEADCSFSIFAKYKGNDRNIKLSLGTGKYASFDLQNGTYFDVQAATVAEIEEYPNGWYRCVINGNISASKLNIILLNNTTETYQGDGASGVYIWGAQLESGSYPTSYIPNYGTSAGITRSAETANGAGDASTFNDSEGVLMAEISALANDGTFRTISINGTPTNVNEDRIQIYYRNTADIINFGMESGNSTQFFSQFPLDVKSNNKLALKYSASSCSFWINGIKVGEELNKVMPTDLSRLDFNIQNGSDNFYGNTKQIQYFDSALNDSDLETLTSWVSFTDLANGQLYSIK